MDISWRSVADLLNREARGLMVASAVGAEGGWGQRLCPLWGPQSSQDVDLPADSERRCSLWVALPGGGRRALTLLHPPLSSSTLPQGRDVALKHYCSEPLKINAQSRGMKVLSARALLALLP